MKRGIELMPKETGDQALEIERIGAMGILCQMLGYLGKRKEVVILLEEYESRYGNNKDEILHIYIQFYKCSGYSLAGFTTKAKEECEKAYKMAREYKNITVEIYSSFFLGRAYASMGDFENAIKSTTKAITLGKENNITIGFYITYFFLIEYYLILGNVSYAKSLFKEGEVYFNSLNADYLQYWKLRILASFELFSHVTNFSKGLQFIDKAIEITRSIGEMYDYYYAQALVIKSFLHEKMDSLEESEQSYQEAIAIFTKLEMQSDIDKSKQLRDKFAVMRNDLQKQMTETEVTFSTTITESHTMFSYQRQLKYILKLAEQLSEVYEMDALLDKIIALAIEVSGAERGILFLYEDDQNSHLKIRAIKSIDENEEKGSIAYSESVLKKTLTKERGQLILDAESECDGDESIINFNMKSIITACVITSGKVLGALYLDNRQVKGLFTNDNFELLKAFAVQAAISIENAKLYEQIHERAKVEQEMEIAKRIQTVLLPKDPVIGGYEITGYMAPADEVGGDYYDVIHSQGKDWIVIGDVSGHGLTAGLVMMMVQTSINTVISMLPELKPSQVLTHINDTISKNIKLLGESKYMTITVLAALDDGVFAYSGLHQDILIYRAKTGEVEAVETIGMWLGVLDHLDDMLLNDTFSLEPGDCCLLFTDGVTEALDNEGNMFSYDSLKDLFQKTGDLSVEIIKEKIIAALEDYQRDDDVTMLVVKRKQ